MGTASGRYPNSNGMEAFGKTGTASDEKDLWFVGGTPYYVTAVWWGYDAPYDMTKTLSKQQAKTRTCVTAWKALMEQAQADLPYKAFPHLRRRGGAPLLHPERIAGRCRLPEHCRGLLPCR